MNKDSLDNRNEKLNIIHKLIKFFRTQDSEKVSKNNRITNSYIYGFEDIVSPSNRIINSSVLTEQLNADEYK